MQHADRDTGWFTSSYSGSTSGNCVEVRLLPAEVGVRDSKDRRGGELALSHAAWRGLGFRLNEAR